MNYGSSAFNRDRDRDITDKQISAKQRQKYDILNMEPRNFEKNLFSLKYNGVGLPHADQRLGRTKFDPSAYMGITTEVQNQRAERLAKFMARPYALNNKDEI